MKNVIIVLLILSVSSCYYDKMEALYPGGLIDPCSTTLPATYTGSIAYIINMNCVSCHNAKNASGNVKLTTLDEIKPYASSGLLINVIERKTGYQPMPPSQALPACEVDKIKLWISNGTPQ